MTTALSQLSRSDVEGLENRGVLEDKYMALQREYRSLENAHHSAAAKHTSWANWTNYVIAPGAGILLGEAINYGIRAWGASGKWGGAFVQKHEAVFTSAPHVLLGGGVALMTVPTASSSMGRDALFAAGAGLATVGAVRLGGAVSNWIQGRASSAAELEGRLKELQQQNAQLAATAQQQAVQLQALNAATQAGGKRSQAQAQA